MSIFKKVAKVADVAKSPQGRRAIEQAKRYAQDPKNKEKIDRVVNKVKGRGKSH
ncbi:hypothetical protein J2S53_000439 [Actinopolyspora lacussalsi]|uniref:MT0933-like antitoxin protein n=2 Tax=Actinopolyspora alba group TaxID=2893675 RepID=A0A1I1V9C4_9ACTN|nr:MULTISPECIES: hypothetical protein [Actinopolyspora alba group]MDP9640494.1 hypothetical protein [Actinopolyspora lacussalsi]SFD79606.1 hypothetical protein SAMN04487819_103196 [Actinopolyspora alba]SFT65975.1 hypothetical protein SAMN04487904_105162 [Actinopolyspora righensis]